MPKQSDSKISTRTLVWCLVYVAIIAVIGLLFVYPQFTAAKRIDGQIASLAQKIEVQRILHPLYQNVNRIRQGTQHKDIDRLPQVLPAALSDEDVNQVQGLIGEIANLSNLKVEKIEPDVNTIIDDSGQMKIAIILTGDFFDFHTFLMTLGEQLPALKAVDSMKIERIQGSAQLQLTLHIWLKQA